MEIQTLCAHGKIIYVKIQMDHMNANVRMNTRIKRLVEIAFRKRLKHRVISYKLYDENCIRQYIIMQNILFSRMR